MNYLNKKYIAHISRNLLITILVFICLYCAWYRDIEILHVMYSAIIFSASYAWVYFLNDYTDRTEDIAYKKSNLYNDIWNDKLYRLIIYCLLIWTTAIQTILVGISWVILILVLYILNILYSFQPIRIRDRKKYRPIFIFILNCIKWIYIELLLLWDSWNLLDTSWYFMLFYSSCAMLMILIYKRHRDKNTIMEVISLISTLIMGAICFILYPDSIAIYLPLVMVLLWLFLSTWDRQIDNISYYQWIYFIYAITIFWFFIY